MITGGATEGGVTLIIEGVWSVVVIGMDGLVEDAECRVSVEGC